jgi:CBS domain-containing protein
MVRTNTVCRTAAGTATTGGRTRFPADICFTVTEVPGAHPRTLADVAATTRTTAEPQRRRPAAQIAASGTVDRMNESRFDQDMLASFITAWRALERGMRRLSDLPPSSDISVVIRSLRDGRVISGSLAEELHQIRRARNQLTHSSVGGGGDPYFVPTSAAVSRMSEIADQLRSPERFETVARRAVCTSGDATLADAIRLMRENDYDHLPYLCGRDRNWCVLTREQIARAVEHHLDPSSPFTLTVSLTVAGVADLVGARRPVHLPPDAAVPVVVEAIYRSARDGYDRGVAPVALCVVRGRARILTLTDLTSPVGESR